jgi:hypothetical protein
MPPAAHDERRRPASGTRVAARPNRPISAARSASARPCHLTAASAHATTRASASPSGDPAGPGGDGSRPSGVSTTATRQPNSDVASCSSWPTLARRRRRQPRTVAAARSRTKGRRARRTPGPRTRHPHRRTAASRQSFPVTGLRSPAGGARRQGQFVLQAARPSAAPQPEPATSRGNDTMSIPGRRRSTVNGSGTPGTHGVVAHGNGNPPPAPDRTHARPERRQPAYSSSKRMAPNRRSGRGLLAAVRSPVRGARFTRFYRWRHRWRGGLRDLPGFPRPWRDRPPSLTVPINPVTC